MRRISDIIDFFLWLQDGLSKYSFKERIFIHDFHYWQILHIRTRTYTWCTSMACLACMDCFFSREFCCFFSPMMCSLFFSPGGSVVAIWWTKSGQKGLVRKVRSNSCHFQAHRKRKVSFFPERIEGNSFTASALWDKNRLFWDI